MKFFYIGHLKVNGKLLREVLLRKIVNSVVKSQVNFIIRLLIVQYSENGSKRNTNGKW